MRVGPGTALLGEEDGFVAKLSADGDPIYSGYVGGEEASTEWIYRGVVDAAGHLYVVGYTTADESSFPVTQGPDLTYERGEGLNDGDGFIAKVKLDGTGFEFCGYVGGARFDAVYGLYVDIAGDIYFAGETASAPGQGFPVAVGPDLTPSGGAGLDGFIAKLRGDDLRYDYCGYIENCRPNAVAVGGDGSAYVSGATDSTDFKVVVGPDLTFNGSGFFYGDAFISRIMPDGTDFIYSGYIGGDDGEGANGGADVAVDERGHAFVVGGSASSAETFPTRVGPWLEKSIFYDAFLVEVSADGREVVQGGFIGGQGTDIARALAFDAVGDIVIVGDIGWFNGVGTQARVPPAGAFPVKGGPVLIPSPPTDIFVTKIRRYLSCKEGRVGGSQEEEPEDVVFINGSVGDAWTGTVKAEAGSPLTVMVQAPLGSPEAPFAMYAWLGAPTLQTVSPLPNRIGGESCFPTPLDGGAVPQPTAIWNNIGYAGRLGTASQLSQPAPSILVALPEGVGAATVTFQGIIADERSESGIGVSLTNGVVLEVR